MMVWWYGGIEDEGISQRTFFFSSLYLVICLWDYRVHVRVPLTLLMVCYVLTTLYTLHFTLYTFGPPPAISIFFLDF